MFKFSCACQTKNIFIGAYIIQNGQGVDIHSKNYTWSVCWHDASVDLDALHQVMILFWEISLEAMFLMFLRANNSVYVLPFIIGQASFFTPHFSAIYPIWIIANRVKYDLFGLYSSIV